MQVNCLFLPILFFRNHSYIHILLFFTYRIVLLLLCHYSKTLTPHYVTFLNQQKHGRPQHNFTIHFFEISIDLDILMKTLHICHSPVNFIVSSLFLLSPLFVMLFPCSTDCCFSFSCLAHTPLCWFCDLLYQCSSFPFSHFTLSFNLLSLSPFGSLPNALLLR